MLLPYGAHAAHRRRVIPSKPNVHSSHLLQQAATAAEDVRTGSGIVAGQKVFDHMCLLTGVVRWQ